MKYDFTTKPDRRGMDAMAVELPKEPIPGRNVPLAPREGFDIIPMWVADMNFLTAPSIPEALIARASHPSYGYFYTREAYYDAILRWHREGHGVTDIQKENIGYENGVLGALCTALAAFTSPGEPILVHSPVYLGFIHVLEDTGRQMICSPLCHDADGTWRMDYEDMERRIVGENIRFAILCSPHNPSGRVWEREELEKAMALFKKHDVLVFSDEIWCDLILSGEHIPTQSLGEDAKKRTIALYAPSKTFNMGGLIGSYHIIYDPYLKSRMDRVSRTTGYNNINVLAQHALLGAYCDTGREWVNELRQVLKENVDYACAFFAEHFPDVVLQKPQGTYMLFPDWGGYLKKNGRTLDDLLAAGWRVGVAWQDGRLFLGDTSIRMNLALPTAYVKEALERILKYVY